MLRYIVILLALTVATHPITIQASAPKCQTDLLKSRTIKIGLLTDGNTAKDKALAELFKKELKTILSPDISAKFSRHWELSADGDIYRAQKAINKLMAPGGPDIIITLGILSSTAAATKRLRKSVVAPVITRSLSRQIQRGKPNLTYIDTALYMEKDLPEFLKVARFSHMTIILDHRDLNGIRNHTQYIREIEKKFNIKIDLIPAGSSAEAVLRNIPPGTDAVGIGPLWHFTQPEEKKLAQGLKAKRIPGFALWSLKQVEQGLLAGTEPKDKEISLARRTAVAVLDICRGTRPEDIKVAFTRNRNLTINMKTARAIGIYPSLLLLTRATVINQEALQEGRRLNIRQAVQEAVSANLELRSAEITIKAGEHKVREEMAGLLPRIDIDTGYRIIDEDRARRSGGATPEKAWTAGAGAKLPLYSESRWAKYTAEKYLQENRRYRMEQVRLDITYDASVAYLNVLRAKTLEKIYRDNLELTKANLERARIRVNTGAAGPDEVYRWESKFANDRRQLLYRESETINAMEALNRILHRPIEEQFQPEETKLTDPLFIVGDKFFFTLMENPLRLGKFKKVAAAQALETRPELHAYDSAIKAKDRLKTAARREIWLPEFSLEWRLDHYLSQSGEGERDGNGLNDNDWMIGVFARIPLFEGGRQMAKAARLEKEVSGLQTDRNALAEYIIQGVLASINRTRASYPSIDLTRQAEITARKNLNLVTESYIQGIKTIIDLLDAQNQFLNAKLEAANAVYNFLIDFMGVQRQTGKFFIFMPEAERQEWLTRIRRELDMHPQTAMQQ